MTRELIDLPVGSLDGNGSGPRLRPCCGIIDRELVAEYDVKYPPQHRPWEYGRSEALIKKTPLVQVPVLPGVGRATHALSRCPGCLCPDGVRCQWGEFPICGIRDQRGPPRENPCPPRKPELVVFAVEVKVGPAVVAAVTIPSFAHARLLSSRFLVIQCCFPREFGGALQRRPKG